MTRIPRSKLALVLLLTVTIGLGTGTAGFSSVAADRPVSINVSDQRAYVGFETSDQTVSSDDPPDNAGSAERESDDDQSVHLVTVTNRLSHSLAFQTVDVTVLDDSSGIEIGQAKMYDRDDEADGEEENEEDDDGEDPQESTLDPGETATLNGAVGQCPVGASSEVEVTVEMNSSGVLAVLDGNTNTATFEVTCPDSYDVEFDGKGNAEISPEDRTVTMTLHFSDGTTKKCAKFDTSQKVKRCLSASENGKTIDAITIDEKTYENPNTSDDDD
ncbi:MAG: hypothetical protein ABEI27_08275 [Halobellus sp.]|uniref:hypothetical protein n=1 Tax=Halobellus sp. TaxID=1979212 RepID=UPI0035D51EC2